jgi:hypothetical protein
MQRINRSAHAPLGTAFFLFLGLAILPFSLRAAGVQVSFSPRLAAAMDAWQQIADVFGASYHPAPASELSVVKDLDSDPSNPIESPVRPSSEFACAQKAEEWAGTVVDVSEARVLKAASVRRASSKSASCRSLPSNRVALVVAVESIKASFEKHASVIGALGAMKLATLKREELLKSFDKQVFKQTFEPIGEVRRLPVSENMRVLVRVKRAAVGSSAKTAECKVFSALASARRHECDRAILTGMTTGSPDNSEF